MPPKKTSIGQKSGIARRKKLQRDCETPVQRLKRLQGNRERMKRIRQNESLDKKLQRLQDNRIRTMLYRQRLKQQRKRTENQYFSADMISTNPEIERQLCVEAENQPLDRLSSDSSKTKSLQTCYYCGKRCSDKVVLQTHLKIHKLSDLQWKDVDKSKTLASFIPPTQTDSTDSLTCKLCDRKFSRLSALNSHMIVHAIKNRFQCHYCTEMFTTKHLLLEHEKSHKSTKISKMNKERTECEECGIMFFSWKNLQKHQSIHRYKCAECSEMNKQLQHLHTHLKEHLQENTYDVYDCDKCENYYTKEKEALLHVKLIHEKKKKKKRKSDSTECSFKEEISSTVQEYKDEKEDQIYKCAECEQVFYSESDLLGHDCEDVTPDNSIYLPTKKRKMDHNTFDTLTEESFSYTQRAAQYDGLKVEPIVIKPIEIIPNSHSTLNELGVIKSKLVNGDVERWNSHPVLDDMSDKNSQRFLPMKHNSYQYMIFDEPMHSEINLEKAKISNCKNHLKIKSTAKVNKLQVDCTKKNASKICSKPLKEGKKCSEKKEKTSAMKQASSCLKCAVCGEVFEFMGHLKVHERVHW